MAVYIDDMYRYAIGQFHGLQMSHMIADSDSELHAMAQRIGMRRASYQGDHYDVPFDRRGLALTFGAVAITYRQCGMMRRRKVVEGHCGLPAEAKDWYRGWQRRTGLGLG